MYIVFPCNSDGAGGVGSGGDGGGGGCCGDGTILQLTLKYCVF